jgi:hypothetical protein
MQRTGGSVAEPRIGRGVPRTSQIIVFKLFDLLTAYKWPACIAFSLWKCVPFLAGRDTKASLLVWFNRVHSGNPVCSWMI